MNFRFPFSSVVLFIARAFKNIFIADSVLNFGLKVNMLYAATKINFVVQKLLALGYDLYFIFHECYEVLLNRKSWFRSLKIII